METKGKIVLNNCQNYTLVFDFFSQMASTFKKAHSGGLESKPPETLDI